jgi:hypothetical protein
MKPLVSNPALNSQDEPILLDPMLTLNSAEQT